MTTYPAVTEDEADLLEAKGLRRDAEEVRAEDPEFADRLVALANRTEARIFWPEKKANA